MINPNYPYRLLYHGAAPTQASHRWIKYQKHNNLSNALLTLGSIMNYQDDQIEPTSSSNIKREDNQMGPTLNNLLVQMIVSSSILLDMFVDRAHPTTLNIKVLRLKMPKHFAGLHNSYRHHTHTKAHVLLNVPKTFDAHQGTCVASQSPKPFRTLIL